MGGALLQPANTRWTAEQSIEVGLSLDHRAHVVVVDGAEALVLEVTESLLMSETSETIDALSGIHAMGVGLAIDDFGTGESSLARLKRFPVKVLKIDKSFVDGLGILETDEAIVTAIVQLSKALGLVVLAEGVETPIQLERVAALGCDLYQGYLMSRPVSAERIDFSKRAETTPQTDLPA